MCQARFLADLCIHPTASLSVNQSASLSGFALSCTQVSSNQYVGLFICLDLHPSVCLSVCLSVHLLCLASKCLLISVLVCSSALSLFLVSDHLSVLSCIYSSIVHPSILSPVYVTFRNWFRTLKTPGHERWNSCTTDTPTDKIRGSCVMKVSQTFRRGNSSLFNALSTYCTPDRLINYEIDQLWRGLALNMSCLVTTTNWEI